MEKEIKIKIPCEHHPQKRLEYICTNPNCKDKLYCSSCLFKKEYCRHDDYLKDINEFLEEQRQQFELKGLLSSPEIYEIYKNKEAFLNKYQGKVNEQIKIVENEFDKVLNTLTVVLNEAKKALTDHLQSYIQAFERAYQIMENKVNNNFLGRFFISKFKNFDDMLSNFSPFTEQSMRSMINPILENYLDQFEIPVELKESYDDLMLMQDDPPTFDMERYEKLKNYLAVFRDKMNQSIATLINVKGEETMVSPPLKKKIIRVTTNNSTQNNSILNTSINTQNSLERSMIKNNSSISLPMIDSPLLKQSQFARIKTTRSRSSLRTHSSLSMLDPPETTEKKRYKSIASVNPRQINTARIQCSASFDTGHSRTIFSILYIGNRLAATCSDDGVIKIWDIITFNCVTEFTGHTAGIRSMALLANGNLVSASWDKTIKIWNTAHLATLSDIDREREYNTFDATFDSGTSEQSKKFGDGCLKTLTGHINAVLCVGVMPDGKTIVSGSTDYTVKMWDSNKGICLKTFAGHQSEVLCLAFTKYSNLILSGSGDRTVKIWNNDKKHNNACIKTLSGHTGFVWCMVLLSDDTTLVTGGLDKYIKVWDIDTGECLKNVIGHLGQILDIKEYKDDTVISADSDGTIKIWSVAKGWQPVATLTKGEWKKAIHGIEVTEDYMILSTGVDKKISIWN